MRKTIVLVVCAAVLVAAFFGVRHALLTRGNGWDDLLEASDHLKTSPKWQAYEQADARTENAPLDLKMQAVDENAGVLSLVHRAVRKRVSIPFDPNPWRAGRLFPKFVRMRELGKLIALAENVQIARGERDAAIDTFEDGIRLGRCLDQQTLINGLVGASVESIAVKPMGQRAWELNEGQCNHLQRCVSELLKVRPDVHSILQGELAELKSSLTDASVTPAKLGEAWDLSKRDQARLVADAAKNPHLLQDIRSQATTLANARYMTLEREWSLPVSRRTPLDVKSLHKAGWPGKVALVILPIGEVGLDSMLKGDVRLKLLAAEAAVTRYRLDHHLLPNDLASAGLGDLATDPFSGKPLVYRVKGGQCFMYSVGPNGKDDGGYGLPSGRGDDVALP